MPSNLRAEAAPKLFGALDGNLEFPTEDKGWAAFFRAQGCRLASYTDLEELTALLLRHEPDFSYLPSANCYFLRGDLAYRGIASACSARTRLPEQSSVLVVAKSNPAADWRALRGARLGYINTFCTTSYFAPSILIAREGLTLDAFFRAFAVAPWQGQIDAVMAGEIDATMVYEDVWLARPDNAEHTKVIGRLDDLPTPPFIARAQGREAFVADLTKRLVAMPAPEKPGALYAGFAEYQAGRMARFFAELERIPGMSKRGVGARV